MSDELYQRVMRYLSTHSSESAEKLNEKLEARTYNKEFKDELVTFVLANNLHDSKKMKEILNIKIKYFKERNKEGLNGEYGYKTKTALEHTLEKYNLMPNLATII